MPAPNPGLLTELGLQFCKEHLQPGQVCDAPAVIWQVSPNTGWIYPRCEHHAYAVEDWGGPSLTWDEVLVLLTHWE